MKNILVLTLLFCGASSGAMEAENNHPKKSFSPGPTREQVSRHTRHRSLSGKMLDMLRLRTDEIKPTASEPNSPESPTKYDVKESPKKTKSLKGFTPANSRNDSPRSADRVRDSYSKALTGAHNALAEIKSWEDCHYILKCRQYLNNARTYSMQLLAQECPNVPEEWLNKHADEDKYINSIKKELETKIASLGPQKK